jgi:hypothetical protein
MKMKREGVEIEKDCERERVEDEERGVTERVCERERVEDEERGGRERVRDRAPDLPGYSCPDFYEGLFSALEEECEVGGEDGVLQHSHHGLELFLKCKKN